MNKKYEYKGKIIENIPYNSEARWFITNKDGSKDIKFKYPERTLKEAKKSIDMININIFLIVSKYFDGEIRSIIGYVNSEEEAISKTKKLSSTIGLSESYIYSYEIIERIK